MFFGSSSFDLYCSNLDSISAILSLKKQMTLNNKFLTKFCNLEYSNSFGQESISDFTFEFFWLTIFTVVDAIITIIIKYLKLFKIPLNSFKFVITFKTRV